MESVSENSSEAKRAFELQLYILYLDAKLTLVIYGEFGIELQDASSLPTE